MLNSGFPWKSSLHDCNTKIKRPLNTVLQFSFLHAVSSERHTKGSGLSSYLESPHSVRSRGCMKNEKWKMKMWELKSPHKFLCWELFSSLIITTETTKQWPRDRYPTVQRKARNLMTTDHFQACQMQHTTFHQVFKTKKSTMTTKKATNNLKLTRRVNVLRMHWERLLAMMNNFASSNHGWENLVLQRVMQPRKSAWKSSQQQRLQMENKLTLWCDAMVQTSFLPSIVNDGHLNFKRWPCFTRKGLFFGCVSFDSMKVGSMFCVSVCFLDRVGWPVSETKWRTTSTTSFSQSC